MPTSKARLLVALLVVSPIFLGSSCGSSDNFIVNSATLCSCSASTEGQCFVIAELWKHTANNLLEVSANDLTNGEFIGTECEGEPGAVDNVWRAVDGFQYNMVGTLNHFNWSYTADEDWNIHVIPNPPFTFLIDNVEALHPGSKSWHKKCGEPRCMETEVSPDKQFWTNPWFFAPGIRPEDTDRNGYSWLEGRQMGFYGPWVMDMDHSFGSEIHPVHNLWFKDHFEGGFGGPEPFDIFWLMFLQDNTGRFDGTISTVMGQRRVGGNPGQTHRDPVASMLRLKLILRKRWLVFTSKSCSNEFVVTSQDADARLDADDGTSHALELNGKVVVRIQEGQPIDDDLGVTFTNLCLGTDGKLRGFVSIRSTIGGNDDLDEEAFHILYAIRSVRKTRPDVVSPDIGNLPVLLGTAKEKGGSLATEGDHYTGDLQLTLHGNKYTTDRDYTISKIEFAGRDRRQEIRFKQQGNAKEVLISSVPLIGGQIIVTTASGRTVSVPSRSVSLSPIFEATVARSYVDAAAAKYLAASVGGITGSPDPSSQTLTALQEVSLKLSPRYVAYDTSRNKSDFPSTFAEELNQLISKDRSKSANLSPIKQSFTVAWGFEAVNLANGQSVPVYTDNRASSDVVRVQLPPNNSIKESVKIEFPTAPNGIIELRATATVTDQKGETTAVVHRLWSHAFQSMDSADEYALLVQTLTGLRDRSVLLLPRPNIKPGDIVLPPDAKKRSAYILNSYLRKTVSDKQVTIEELRTIVHALKNYSVTQARL
ncbi:MAG: hypothetical protein M3410_08250 [Acidobacteriota bacterium]|nr:hypothetical protein [Acidobacteriota bacterium]